MKQEAKVFYKVIEGKRVNLEAPNFDYNNVTLASLPEARQRPSKQVATQY